MTLSKDSTHDVNHKLVLAPGVPILQRSADEVQVGITPRQSFIVGKQFATEILSRCKGQYSLPELTDLAPSLGLDSASTHNVIRNLMAAGSLVSIDPTPSTEEIAKLDYSHQLNAQRETHGIREKFQTRSEVEIIIDGAGRLGTLIGVLLAVSGFAHIQIRDNRLTSWEDVSPWGASRVDIGIRRDFVANALINRVHRNSVRGHLPALDARRRLAIVVPDQTAEWPWLNPLLSDKWLAANTPHLVCAAANGVARITSVITPGEQPCIRCLTQHHIDQDPGWATVMPQLIDRPTQDRVTSSLMIGAARWTVDLVTQWIDRGISTTADDNQEPRTLPPDTGELWQLSEHELVPQCSLTHFHASCGCAWDRFV